MRRSRSRPSISKHQSGYQLGRYPTVEHLVYELHNRGVWVDGNSYDQLFAFGNEVTEVVGSAVLTTHPDYILARLTPSHRLAAVVGEPAARAQRCRPQLASRIAELLLSAASPLALDHRFNPSTDTDLTIAGFEADHRLNDGFSFAIDDVQRWVEARLSGDSPSPIPHRPATPVNPEPDGSRLFQPSPARLGGQRSLAPVAGYG